MSKVDYDAPDYEPDETDATIDRCVDRVMHRQSAELALELEQASNSESELERVRRLINAPSPGGAN